MGQIVPEKTAANPSWQKNEERQKWMTTRDRSGRQKKTNKCQLQGHASSGRDRLENDQLASTGWLGLYTTAERNGGNGNRRYATADYDS